MSSTDLTVEACRKTFKAIQEMVDSGTTYSSYFLTTTQRSFSLNLSCDLITRLEFDKPREVKLYLIPSLHTVFKGKCSGLTFDGLFALPVCAFEDQALQISLPRQTRTKISCGVLSPELRNILLELNPEFSVRSIY